MLQIDYLRFKTAVIQALGGQLSVEIEQLKREMHEIQAAANEETKSSSGDKYETGRAMAHLELEKLNLSLSMKQDALSQLRRINKDLKTIVQPGSLVYASSGIFFIGVHGSTVNVENQKVTSITLASPLAKALLGTSVGSIVKINEREIFVEAVY
jgi:hypothetical protein